MSQTTKIKFIMNITAIMLIFLFAGAGSLLSAAVQTFAEAWGGVSFSVIIMVNTVPALVSMPVMIIMGKLVGEQISYKATIIIGTILVIVGGIVPFYYAPSWTVILMFRAIIGVGAGFYGVRTALLIKSVPTEKQTKYIGISSFFFSGGNIIISPIVGILAGISWKHPFLINCFAIIILLMVVCFLIEPKNDAELSHNRTLEDRSIVKAKINKKTYLYVLFQFATTCAIYPMISGMSTFIDLKELGTPALAGTLLAINTIGGALVSLFLSQIQKVFKDYILTFAFALIAVGEYTFLTFSSITVGFISMFMVGSGFLIVFSMLQVYNGAISHTSKVAFSSTLILAGNQVAMFASSLFIIGAHSFLKRNTVIESSWLGGVIIFATLVVLTVVFNKGVVPQENGNVKLDAL